MVSETLGVGMARALRAHGVTTVFGIPGVHNVELYRGLETAGITHILARHEQGAGFMADGYARATGKPGVAFVITGPGLTNIMTPMGQAYSDSVPMLVVSSCLPKVAEISGQLHEMRDQSGAAATVCDWSIEVEDGPAAFEALNQAFAEFPSARARPKHISVPIDILGGPGARIPAPLTVPTKPQATPEQLTDLVARLEGAEKPLFIFGGGAVEASEAANQLVQKTKAAVFTTFAGRGVIDPDYPLLFGSTLSKPDGAAMVGQADLVVVVGSEMAQVDLWRNQLGHRAQMVRIDIDPVVLSDQHGADVKILADATPLLAALNDQLAAGQSEWRSSAAAESRAQFRAQADADRPGILPYVDTMQAVLPADALIYSDMTQFAYVAKETYQMAQTKCWHHPFGFGTLGYAMPAAIGGKIGCPDRDVVAIAGDSGFQYTLSQLGLAAELSLCLPIVLWDNGKLGEIEDCMIRAQIAPNAVVAKNPDFHLLARAYGVGYDRPSTPAEFQTALRAALKTERPTIIHLSPNGAT